jgi:hypothetical protein
MNWLSVTLLLCLFIKMGSKSYGATACDCVCDEHQPLSGQPSEQPLLTPQFSCRIPNSHLEYNGHSPSNWIGIPIFIIALIMPFYLSCCIELPRTVKPAVYSIKLS